MKSDTIVMVSIWLIINGIVCAMKALACRIDKLIIFVVHNVVPRPVGASFDSLVSYMYNLGLDFFVFYANTFRVN